MGIVKQQMEVMVSKEMKKRIGIIEEMEISMKQLMKNDERIMKYKDFKRSLKFYFYNFELCNEYVQLCRNCTCEKVEEYIMKLPLSEINIANKKIMK